MALKKLTKNVPWKKKSYTAETDPTDCQTLLPFTIFFWRAPWPVFSVWDEKAVDADGEGVEAQGDHQGGGHVEPGGPEVQLKWKLIVKKKKKNEF